MGDPNDTCLNLRIGDDVIVGVKSSDVILFKI